MKIVLNQDVKGLGTAGQVKEVADGYARNYLIPRGLASPATPEALRRADARKAAETKRAAEDERQAQTLASMLTSQPLSIQARVGEKGRLYGSITSADIAEALGSRAGQPIDKRRVDLEDPIRSVGTYHVPVRLHARVTATVEVQVVASGE